jgi:SAM-dependent methyltransferase
MRDRYPNCRWEGLEPLGQGFARVGSLLQEVKGKYDLVIHDTSLEAFETQRTFDFIFSLNVLEHVHSWRDCLAKMHALLRPGGIAVVLCPNYSFPYEPHYALPILFTKDLTYRVFQSRIARHDDRCRTHDLWSSLNFIKKREVIAFCRGRGIRLSFDEAIMTRMVEKLWADPRFAERQGGMSGPAKLLHRLGVTRLVENYPFNRLSPYQKLCMER